MGESSDGKKTRWLRHLKKQLDRPNQGPSDGPYWIVLNLSQHKDLNFKPPSFPFRHATLEAATKEAARLASTPHMIGWRFGVFRFTGLSSKTNLPDADELPIAAEAANVEQVDG